MRMLEKIYVIFKIKYDYVMIETEVVLRKMLYRLLLGNTCAVWISQNGERFI